MTDRVQNLTVILDRDFRDDDVEYIANAIRMIKGVHRVEHGEPVSVGDYVARERARIDLQGKILDLFKSEKA